MSAFAALSDPTRRRIVELLARGEERSAGELVREFRTSQPAVSQHLRRLRDARLVLVRAEGRQRFYRLEPAGLDEVEDWMVRTRAAWTRRLDALEAQVAKRPASKGGPR